MKSMLVIIAVFVAIACAKPAEQNVAVTQDTAGNYKFAVNLDGYSRVEKGNSDGTVSGSYSYIDANGVPQSVHYTAGPDGFRATGDSLPQAPVDPNSPIGHQELPL